MIKTEHAEALYHRMPPADHLWDSPQAQALFLALSGAPANVDHAAAQHLHDYMPDTCGDTGAYIADWARILSLPRPGQSAQWNAATNAEKAAIIRAALARRGPPTLANLQRVATALFGEDAVLSHHEHSPFLVGASGAGDGVGDAWQAVWTLRYMENVLAFSPDSFSGWGGATSAVSGTQSPRTLTATASQVTGTTHGGTGLQRITADVDAEDGDALRLSVWYRSPDAAKTFKLALQDRAGAQQIGAALNAKPDLWQKAEMLVSAGTGGFTPEMWLLWDSGDILLSWAVAGVRLPGSEAQMQSAAPAHTIGEFLVVNE